MTRFPELKPENYTPEQRAIADEIVKSRGSMRGPFHSVLYSPGVANAVEVTGKYLRFHNSLPDPVKEFAILITGRFWTAQYEWYAHSKLALEAGVSPETVEAVRQGQKPAKLSPEQEAIYTFCTELHRTHAVSDQTFKAVADKFGLNGVMDLIGLCGHYTTISMVLNVAQVTVPDGTTPLAPLPGQG